MRHVILIGFMGCGKSTVGIRLSYRLRRVVEDTDKRIEREQKKTVSEIFAENGEAYFRDLETDLLSRMGDEKGFKIISTGGGLPIREENRALLHGLGRVIYLRAKPETIYNRLKHDTTRPLLQGDDPLAKIQSLMGQRSSLYENAADVIVDVDDKSIDQILEEIVEVLGYENTGNKRTKY